MVDYTYRPIGRDLKDYLVALRECRDSELTGELGVYDNWPVLFGTELEALARDFEESGIWKIYLSEAKDTGRCYLNHRNGIVEAQLMNFISDYCTTGFGFNFNEDSRKRSEFEKTFFKSALMLHPYQKKGFDLRQSEWKRKMAEAIQDIAEYAIQKKISLAFPQSYGVKYFNSEDFSRDYSRIVYYFSE
jgi:hypothetical protein